MLKNSSSRSRIGSRMARTGYTLLSPLFLAAILCLPACHSPEKAAPPDILVTDLDTSISPATDFFQYANGGWIRKTPIPPEESSWGIDKMVQEDIYARLRKISEAAAAEKAAPGTVSQQIGDLWSSGMDSAAIDRNGLSPLQQEFDK